MKKTEVELGLIVFPVAIILTLAGLIFFLPEQFNLGLEFLHNIFVNKLGVLYILLGLFVVIASIYVACSRYGNIKLGDIEKPKYNNWQWGGMIFTSTMAADLLYWALIEWAYYYSSDPMAQGVASVAMKQRIASTYPIFHWGPIPWGFYILPAAAYAYMLFVKGRKKQTLSEACRPIIKNRADGLLGKVIDTFAITGLLAGTATSFSLATPLLSGAISKVFRVPESKMLTLVILLLIGAIFTVVVLAGMDAISKLASIAVYLFFALLIFFFIFGPKVYIIESAVSSFGNLIQNFLGMATWTDPTKATMINGTTFPQQWTIFYWAYWISWFVATPFFIAQISKGRTIRQMIFGAYFYGLSGTFLAFSVFGNYGIFHQISGNVDAAGLLANGSSPTSVILQIFDQFQFSSIVLIILICAMVAFYASTFDALTMVVASFTDKKANGDQEPSKRLRAFWAVLFVVLPIALIWSDSTLASMQTIAIVAAFPLGIIMLVVILSFYKELKARKDSSN